MKNIGLIQLPSNTINALKKCSVISEINIKTHQNFCSTKNLKYITTDCFDRADIIPRCQIGTQRIKNSVYKVIETKIRKLKPTENLSNIDIKNLQIGLKAWADEEAFTMVATGARPAMSTGVKEIKRINAKGFKTLLIKKTNAIILFNDSEMLKTIERHKDFFEKRLGLSNTSKKEIYNILTSENSPLQNIEKYQDLIGISFGYPVKNTIIFQLQSDVGISTTAGRKDIVQYKKNLIKTLFSNKTVYKDFDTEFKNKIANDINSIRSIGNSELYGYPEGYGFITYINDPEEFMRINKTLEKFAKNMERLAESEPIANIPFKKEFHFLYIE